MSWWNAKLPSFRSHLFHQILHLRYLLSRDFLLAWICYNQCNMLLPVMNQDAVFNLNATPLTSRVLTRIANSIINNFYTWQWGVVGAATSWEFNARCVIPWTSWTTSPCRIASRGSWTAKSSLSGRFTIHQLLTSYEMK